MPKKRNFLGGMQNYDPKTGEYTKDSSGSSKKEETIKKNYPVNESVEEKPIKQFASFGKSSFNSVNSGYDGYSMSNRAREAYDKGEKPYSKWTKEDIIDSLPEEYRGELKKIPTDTLRAVFLKRTSWHHTGKYFNKTNFYSINEDVNVGEFLEEREADKIKERNDKQLEKEFNALSEEEKQKVYDDYNKQRYEAILHELEIKKKVALEFMKENKTPTEFEFLLSTLKSDNPFKIVRKEKGGIYDTEQILHYTDKPKLVKPPKWYDPDKIDSYTIEGSYYDNVDRDSMWGDLYPLGKVPTYADREKGLEHFFTKGDKMYDKELDKIMTWNGKEWE